MGIFKKLFEMPNDSRVKTVSVAFLLCLVCSLLVSTAAVALRPVQEANKLADKRRNILEIAGMMQDGGDVNELFKKIEPRVVDLATGQYVDDIDATEYDQREAAKDPAQSQALSSDVDIASIRRRADKAARMAA